MSNKEVLTLLHSERLKLYTILAFLSAIGLNDPDELKYSRDLSSLVLLSGLHGLASHCNSP